MKNVLPILVTVSFATSAIAETPSADLVKKVDNIVARLSSRIDDSVAISDLYQLPPSASEIVGDLSTRESIPEDVRVILKKEHKELCAKARIQSRQSAYAKWVAGNTIEAYKKAGSRSEAWDAAAIQGLEIVAARLWGSFDFVDLKEWRLAYDALDAATRAGCDDALVLYAKARTYARLNNQDVQELSRPLPSCRRSNA